MNFPVGLIKCSESEWCTPLQKMIRELVTRYLPLVASRGDASGGEAVTFASTAVSQTLAVLHHTALSLLRVEGDLLHREVLVLLLRLALRVSTESVSRPAKNARPAGCGWRLRFPHLQFELLDLLFDLGRVFGLSDRSFPHAVGQQGEEPLHHLRTAEHLS